MLVSIIVPVYNTATYLDKCIDSLLRQSYKEIEVILVNDGSTDSSLEVCKKYKSQDSRIVIVDKKNGGASSARNAGIAVATGEYIMFTDSDDYADKSYVQEMLAAQLNHEDALVLCDLCGILGDNRFWPFHEEIDAAGVFAIQNYYQFSKWLLLNQPYNKIFSLKKIKEHELGFKENLPIGEDIYFNLEYLQYCRELYFVNKELYFCLRDRDDSLCHKNYENLMSINDMIFDKHRELFALFDVSETYQKKLISNYYGQHIDCLDREIVYAKSKKTMYANVNAILKRERFQICIDSCKADIPKLYYYMLCLKSPRAYRWYNKLSKMRWRR